MGYSSTEQKSRARWAGAFGQVNSFTAIPAFYEMEARAMEPAITVNPGGSPESPAAGGRAAIHRARCPVTVVPHE
ncbi:hypothetical protein [Streptomyces sp. KMM 9044]|uniref:hypothetical protein n=1 Tax=Streptomyces sp. KMM 9044 TaxID=2744474 RepID=UPI0021516D57|nr:hypothetical protein [Streptomyces sp. KMM 9044]WAX81487.1 hypothetical protein HUV60_031535 [Streptomyces sp. KMM 9044]